MATTLSVISKTTYNQVLGDQLQPLKTEKVKLRTFTGQEIPVKGSLEVEAEHGGEHKKPVLIVMEGQGPSLLRRKIGWENSKSTGRSLTKYKSPTLLSVVLKSHEVVFQKELGTINCMTTVDPRVPPEFHKSRLVPSP